MYWHTRNESWREERKWDQKQNTKRPNFSHNWWEKKLTIFRSSTNPRQEEYRENHPQAQHADCWNQKALEVLWGALRLDFPCVLQPNQHTLTRWTQKPTGEFSSLLLLYTLVFQNESIKVSWEQKVWEHCIIMVYKQKRNCWVIK